MLFKSKPQSGKGLQPIADQLNVDLSVANYYVTPYAQTIPEWVRAFASDGLDAEEVSIVLALPLKEVNKYFPGGERSK